MLWKDIRQLDLMTEGFLIINEYPEEIIQMVYQKTIDIQNHLQHLSQYKEDLQDIKMPGEPDEIEVSDEPVQDIQEEGQHEYFIDSVAAPIDEIEVNQDLEEVHSQSVEEIIDLTEELNSNNNDVVLFDSQSSPEVFEVENESVFQETSDDDNNQEAVNDGHVDENEPIIHAVDVLKDENEVEMQSESDAQFKELESEMALESVDGDLTIPIEIEESLPRIEQYGNLVIPGFEMEEVAIDQPSMMEDETAAMPTFQPSLFSSNPTEQPQIFGVENRRITDVKKAISIGERFRFQRELFNGNGEDMNKTLTFINHAVTLAEAMDYLEKKYKWERNNESANDFFRIIKRRFI